MIYEILRVMIGVLVLFVPGYFLSPLFTDAKGSRRVYISFGISLVFIVLLGFFLTFIGNVLGVRGFTLTNIMIPILIISVIGLVQEVS